MVGTNALKIRTDGGMVGTNAHMIRTDGGTVGTNALIIRMVHRVIYADFVMSRTEYNNIHTFLKIFREFVFAYQKNNLILLIYSTMFLINHHFKI